MCCDPTSTPRRGATAQRGGGGGGVWWAVATGGGGRDVEAGRADAECTVPPRAPSETCGRRWLLEDPLRIISCAWPSKAPGLWSTTTTSGGGAPVLGGSTRSPPRLARPSLPGATMSSGGGGAHRGGQQDALCHPTSWCGTRPRCAGCGAAITTAGASARAGVRLTRLPRPTTCTRGGGGGGLSPMAMTIHADHTAGIPSTRATSFLSCDAFICTPGGGSDGARGGAPRRLAA